MNEVCAHGSRQDADYWHAWQDGRAWAREREFYGVPWVLSKRWVRGFLYGHVFAAPVLLILWAAS